MYKDILPAGLHGDFAIKIYYQICPCVATGEKHEIAIENDDIMLHIYLYLSFL